MAKKDFIAIAAVLKTFDRADNHWLLCLAFVVRFSQINPRFNPTRFATACGLSASDVESFADEVRAVLGR